MGDVTRTELKGLKGATLSEIEGLVVGSGDVRFETTPGRVFRMWHDQDCCENVQINEIEGDIADLIGVPLLEAVAIHHELKGDEDGDSQWTFYDLATIKGRVQIRWHGSSNGYYSTGVSFEEIE